MNETNETPTQSPMNTEKLPDYTSQEIFNKVARHLLTQNEKAQKGIHCMYRLTVKRMNKEGVEESVTLKCGAGAMIEDEDYKVEMENKPIGYLVGGEQISRLNYDSHDFLLSRLQAVHDGVDVCEWKNKLGAVGREFKLNTDVLNEFPN